MNILPLARSVFVSDRWFKTGFFPFHSWQILDMPVTSQQLPCGPTKTQTRSISHIIFSLLIIYGMLSFWIPSSYLMRLSCLPIATPYLALAESQSDNVSIHNGLACLLGFGSGFGGWVFLRYQSLRLCHHPYVQKILCRHSNHFFLQCNLCFF